MYTRVVVLKRSEGTPRTQLEPKYSSVISSPSFSCFSPYCWRPEITSCTTFASVARLSPAVNIPPLCYLSNPWHHNPSFLRSARCLNSWCSSWLVHFITSENRCLLCNVLKKAVEKWNSVSFTWNLANYYWMMHPLFGKDTFQRILTVRLFPNHFTI